MLDDHFVSNDNLTLARSEIVQIKIEIKTENVLCDVTTDTQAASQIVDTKTEGHIPDTKDADQIKELMLHKEKHQVESQIIQTEVDMQLKIFKYTENEKNEKEKENYIKKPQEMKEYINLDESIETRKAKECIAPIKGKELAYDASERFGQLDDVNANPERNGASERHANRTIYYINTNSDDHRDIYTSIENGIVWHQSYMLIYILIIKLEVLKIQRFVIIFAKDVAAKNRKMKVGYLNVAIYAIGYSAYMQILTKTGVAEPNNVTSAMGFFACTQIPKKTGATEQNSNQEDIDDTLEVNGENIVEEEEEVAEHCQETWNNMVTCKTLGMFTTENRDQDQADASRVKDLTQDRLYMVSSINGGEGTRGNPGKKLMFEIAIAGARYKHESTGIEQYRNIIRNETCRMMISIDMVVSVAKHLFGVERTRIFFDFLDDELFHFGSAGAILDFVPNMAESTVRQHVISFFECASDTMNRLMTLLLGCPDNERLQKMPEEKFISLMQSAIDSSYLKPKTKEGEKPASKVTKRTKLILVDSEEFERAVGEEISEDVLYRLRRGDKMIVHMFFDTRLERPQSSEIRENRPIHSIYFPSDCRLFIYIPTENGSYWHQSDMGRASRIRRHAK